MSFRINRVYTRSGDSGETSLIGGARVPKHHPRVSAYGDVDELNAALGLAKEQTGGHTSDLRALLEFLQQELFDVGAELARPASERSERSWLTTTEHIERLESLCDHFGENLPELQSFILPGGSPLAAALHLARTIARRAERTASLLAAEPASAEAEPAVRPETLAYLNRLSDLLFVLARWALHKEGKTTPLWTQEQARSLPVDLKK